MSTFIRIIFWLWPLFFFTACNVANTDEGCIIPTGGELPPEGTPTQFCIEGDPEIRFVYSPESPEIIVNEPALKLSVVSNDSIPHQKWLPTLLHIETDQGFRKMIPLVPFACIRLIENSTEEFPFNVEWWSCNKINVNNRDILTDEQIKKIEEQINGRLLIRREFKSMSGEQYVFDLAQIGQNSIDNAIDQVQSLPFIQPADGKDENWNVSHSPQFPLCWLDDTIPPPPCPPWSLIKTLRLSFEEEKENHITVQEGGWVRATYTLPDGSSRSTTFTVPEIDQVNE